MVDFDESYIRADAAAYRWAMGKYTLITLYIAGFIAMSGCSGGGQHPHEYYLSKFEGAYVHIHTSKLDGYRFANLHAGVEGDVHMRYSCDNVNLVESSSSESFTTQSERGKMSVSYGNAYRGYVDRSHDENPANLLESENRLVLKPGQIFSLRYLTSSDKCSGAECIGVAINIEYCQLNRDNIVRRCSSVKIYSLSLDDHTEPCGSAVIISQ